MPAPKAGPQRLDQLLSRLGYCSRREAGRWLRDGRVLHRGTPADDPAQKVLAGDVQVDGQPVEAPDGLLVMLHKPAGHVCSHDPGEGPRIYDLLPPRWLERNPPVSSVGRLDREATGLLLLTDVGEWLHRWTSPKHHVEKTYEVTVETPLRPEWIELFAAGTLHLDGEPHPCRPARLEIIDSLHARLHLTEGRYHQVRRMFAAVGTQVTRLHRSRFGEFDLGTLAPGAWTLLPPPCFG